MYAGVNNESGSKHYVAIGGAGSQPYPTAVSYDNLTAKDESYLASSYCNCCQKPLIRTQAEDLHKKCTQIIELENEYLDQVFKSVFTLSPYGNGT